MFWKRLRRLWADREEGLADRELRREAAEGQEFTVPHTGGALFDEPFEPTETVPKDDAPDV